MTKRLGSQGNFLVGADLGDNPDERLGRRKKARMRNEKREAADVLAAEETPRTQSAWLDEERKRTKLPTKAADGGDYAGVVAKPKVAPDEEGATIGKKKARRMAQLNAKKAQKVERKADKEREALTAFGQSKQKKKKDDTSAVAAELIQKCQGGVQGQQRLLAVVAERVSGNPEKDLDLFDVFLELHANGGDERTRHLALLSAVAVFKDLVPGYRIREPTEAEKATLRSRQVIALERYELGLLRCYRRLLPLLEAAMRRDPEVFAAALAALVTAASEFNYRQRLIGTAVKHATGTSDAVRGVLAEALREMVAGDQRLESSREVVLAVGRLAQSTAQARRGPKGGGDAVGGGDPNVKAQGLKSELFKVLLCVPIGKLVDDAALQDTAGRLEGADEEVKRGLDEASITQNADKLLKGETELLMEIFVVYLRILKQRHLHGKELLPAVLTGLARWGQQVNIELLLEILVELRCLVLESLARSDELIALQGLYCTLVLLSGDSKALVTDVSWLADSFRNALKLALPSLHSAHSQSLEWPPQRCFFMEGRHARASKKDITASLEADSVPVLVLRCLEAALKCPAAYGKASDGELAQLIEHLLVLAAAADPRVGFALLRESALLLRRHFRLHAILDWEGGLFGLGGVTERSVSVVWHLQALAFSIVPDLAKAGQDFAKTVSNRRANVSDLFPLKDSHKWLSAEVVSHIAALSKVPTPTGGGPDRGKAAIRAKLTTAFLSETELQAICADDQRGKW